MWFGEALEYWCFFYDKSNLFLPVLERCDKSNQGLPICNNNFTKKACLYIKSTTGPTQPILMADHRPTTLRPKKMLYPSLHKHKCIAETPPHQSPVTPRSGDGATAPAEGKTTSRRAVSPSARCPRRGCSGRGAAKVRPPRRKPASSKSKQPRQSQIWTETRFASNRCVMCQFIPKQRTIQQVMEWIGDLTSASYSYLPLNSAIFLWMVSFASVISVLDSKKIWNDYKPGAVVRLLKCTADIVNLQHSCWHTWLF